MWLTLIVHSYQFLYKKLFLSDRKSGECHCYYSSYFQFLVHFNGIFDGHSIIVAVMMRCSESFARMIPLPVISNKDLS